MLGPLVLKRPATSAISKSADLVRRKIVSCDNLLQLRRAFHRNAFLKSGQSGKIRRKNLVKEMR